MATDEAEVSVGTDTAGQGDVSGDDTSTTEAQTTVAESGDGEAVEGSDSGTEGSAGEENNSPEAYTDFDLPEGVNLDNAMLEKASPLFKELGLSQDQAQMVVGLYADKMQETAQGQVDAFSQQVTDWESAAKADKEFGGDKFDENLSVAKLGMEKLGTPELKDFLEKSGAGSHPEVLRAFYRAGALLREDNPGAGDPASEKVDRVSVLYPDLN